MCCHCVFVPLGGHDRDPPALDLTQLWIRHLYIQWQTREPNPHLQLSAQVTVGEVHQHPHSPLGFFPIHVDKVASVRHLRASKMSCYL